MLTMPVMANTARSLNPGILSVSTYGSGHVNDTYLVSLSANHNAVATNDAGLVASQFWPPGIDSLSEIVTAPLSKGQDAEPAFILQRLNPLVFPEPEKIMANLRVLEDHVRPRLKACRNRRWELPQIIPASNGNDYFLDEAGALWRAQTFISGARSCTIVSDQTQAREMGRGLGFFHALLKDLPVNLLHDTLPGFHVTPGYLPRYEALAAAPSRRDASAAALFCHRFIRERQDAIGVLEEARRRGELRPCPIHGDPKPANFLFAEDTGEVLSLIDLDTVKPGLIHYDLGDCLRACANPAGEDAVPAEISFNLSFFRALLDAYLPEVTAFFSNQDYHYIYDAVRIIAFELGLRFFADHLAGDVYFKVKNPGHNLRRALVQFALCKSIENQEKEIRMIVAELSKR